MKTFMCNVYNVRWVEKEKKLMFSTLKMTMGTENLTFSHLIHPFTDLDSIEFFDLIAQQHLYGKFNVCSCPH